MAEITSETVPALIMAWAETRPDHVALVDKSRSLNFAELKQAIFRSQNYLLANKVNPGDRVGLCLQNDMDFLIAMLAVAALGGIAIGMDWRARPQEKSRQLSEFGIKFVLSGTGVQVPEQTAIINFEHRSLSDDPVAGTPENIEIDHPFLINVTSGTTGKPKGLLLSHRQYLARYEVTRRALAWGDDEVYFSAGHLAFTATRNCCLFHLLSGNTVILFPALHRAEELVAAVNQSDATMLFIVPTRARRLLQMAENIGHLLPSLRSLWLTGATMHGEEKQQLARLVNPNVYDEYGASGFGTISCLQPGEIDRYADSVGKPAPGIEAEVVDDDHQPQPTGMAGRLRCRAHGMATDFTEANQSGHEFFHDGWYYSGELAKFNAEGFLFLMGRASDFIISGGANVNPEEVEKVLLDHPDIIDCAVTGVAAGELGEAVTAFIVTRDAIAKADLKRHCQQVLSAYKVPAEFRHVAEIPRTISGKIKRRQLLELSTIGPDKVPTGD